ncbi:BEN domain-containing protein 2 [Chelonia mydas]|uniref:BEN domain-containing protein 2 n=1 Tax=Chelonia mydas TaxID=8469 RepID=M7B0S9_CHEMY|nr:BEN domain-containing protein 2 [Chelonia mydas]
MTERIPPGVICKNTGAQDLPAIVLRFNHGTQNKSSHNSIYRLFDDLVSAKKGEAVMMSLLDVIQLLVVRYPVARSLPLLMNSMGHQSLPLDLCCYQLGFLSEHFITDYVSVRVEDDVEAVIIQNSEIEDAENGLSTQGCVSVEQNAQVNSDDHYMTQLAYGGEGLSVLSEPVVSQMSHSTGVQRDGQNPEEMEYVFLHKRRRLTPSLVRNNMIRSRETEYEDGGSVIYEYEPDYECGSVVSEASYTGDQQKTLMEVLNYCQAMYDAIQKLDKKFDLLHRKVSEMQHTRMKPLLLKPVSIKDLNCSESLYKQYVGDPKRNVKVLGNYLMKARQKTKPKYAARYLVRVLFPKETLLCSIMGVSARGRRTLDPNKVAAVREFLAAHFPNYDLSEYGRDWKTCITNVNAMIRCLRCETKINPETTEGKEKPADTPDTSICVDLNYNGEDSEVNSQSSQKMTSSTTNRLQNTTWDKVPEMFHAPSSNKLQSLEPMEHLGSPWRNVQLPFSVIYVAKGKSRPELSARYLIRHLFTEDVLVKSNVYGNLERGMCPLDCNRINALRDFLQENYPSFDLKETGYDWKACVAAINSTIRSLRHDHKKAAIGVRKKVLATPPSSEKSPPQSPTSVKPYESDTINLTD